MSELEKDDPDIDILSTKGKLSILVDLRGHEERASQIEVRTGVNEITLYDRESKRFIKTIRITETVIWETVEVKERNNTLTITFQKVN